MTMYCMIGVNKYVYFIATWMCNKGKFTVNMAYDRNLSLMYFGHLQSLSEIFGTSHIKPAWTCKSKCTQHWLANEHFCEWTNPALCTQSTRSVIFCIMIQDRNLILGAQFYCHIIKWSLIGSMMLLAYWYC